MLSGNDEITRLNSDVTTTMNLVVVSSQVLHILTYAKTTPVDSSSCNNMLKHDWTILLFYQSCSIMLTVLLQGCWANNLWYFYACMSRAVSESCVQIRFSEWKWNCQASEVVALYQILINVTCAKHCVHKRPLPLACQEFCFQNAPVSRSRSKLRTQ